MNNEDKIIQLAFSIYSNPGIYALLVGSGISRSAGIPTGWETMLDLIGKISVISGEKNIKNPEKWYREKFNEEPSYSNLLSRVAKTEEERKGILREYFEPNEDELKEGKKLPTRTHKAIAKLVKEGYIRMILTTNFDRLIERAFEESGVSDYQVISMNSKIKGMTPYAHRVTIVKLHGDYLDGEMKNTAGELSKYSRSKNKLLNNVFEDFGLIVSGWSAEYDIALREALCRRKNKRYSTYWADIKEPKEEAKELIRFLQADLINIENADEFFDGFVNKIEALEEYNKPHPLSETIVLEEIKKYLPEEKYDIKLEGLLTEEINKVLLNLKQNFFGLTNEGNIRQKLNYRIGKMQFLEKGSSLIGYFGSNRHEYLLKKIVEEFIVDDRGGTIYRADCFPALFLLYVLGISAVIKEKYKSLATILLKTRTKGRETKPLIEKIYISSEVNGFVEHFFKEEYSRHHTPANDYIFDSLINVFDQIGLSENRYEYSFNLFEYIYGLTYLWLNEANIEDKPSVWAPYGRFIWRCNNDYTNSSIGYFLKDGEDKGENWEFLKAGFFNGSIEEFRKYNEKYIEFLQKIKSSLGIRL